MTRTKNPLSHPAGRPTGLGARAKARLERVAIVAGVFLPVPLLAATGLSIPLPSVVERLAATLVPWAEAATITNASFITGANGEIIFAPSDGTVDAEPLASAPATTPGQPEARPKKGRPAKIAGPRPGDRVGVATPVPGGAPSAGPTAATPREAPASQPPAPGPAEESRPATDDSAQSPQPPSEDPKPPAGGDEPKPPSEPEPVTAPVEDAVEDVADAVDPVVETVEDTVEDTVKDPVGTVTGLPPIR